MKTSERNQEIERFYQSGKTLEAIGSLYQISKQRVQQILSKMDTPMRTMSDYALPLPKEEVVRYLRSKGWGWVRIGKECHCNPATLADMYYDVPRIPKPLPPRTVCSKCKRTLPPQQFFKKHPWCKSCHAESTKEYRQTHKEELRVYNREYKKTYRK